MTTYEAVAVPLSERKRSGRLRPVLTVFTALLWLPALLFVALVEGAALAGAEEEGDGFGLMPGDDQAMLLGGKQR